MVHQLIGPPRRLRPVLAELVELVGRCARGDAERQHVLQRPRVSAVGIDADREIVHDAEFHARLDGRGLRGGELVVELPLQPAVKVDGLGVLGGEIGDRMGCRMLQILGPLVPVVPVLLGERTPGGEVVEAAALPAAGRRRTPAPGPPTVRRDRRFPARLRLAFHAASRSIRLDFFARACTSTRALRMLPRCRTYANSAIASTRRYSGLMNRRDVGRYGDGSIGGVGAAACNGLTRTKPAPCREADHTARSARSVKSPMPQDRCERTL